MHASLEKKCTCVAANVEIKRRQEANKLQITNYKNRVLRGLLGHINNRRREEDRERWCKGNLERKGEHMTEDLMTLVEM